MQKNPLISWYEKSTVKEKTVKASMLSFRQKLKNGYKPDLTDWDAGLKHFTPLLIQFASSILILHNI